jgi:hypothetical protein
MSENCLSCETETPDGHFDASSRPLPVCFRFDVGSTNQRPDKAFWPREVRISEDIKLEQKTKYGLVTSKRSSGSVVKVVSLDSDSLKIESDGFLGRVSVEKTDFWDRAERTKSAAIERQKNEG